MKIGFFGNANNCPFLLARALRRMGHEVLFLLDQKMLLNRPESRFEDIKPPYPDWIKDLSPLDLWQFPPTTHKRREAVSLLKECDAVILNEYGLSLYSDISRPTIAYLTGTDLESLANYDYIDWCVSHYSRYIFPKNFLKIGFYNAYMQNIRLFINDLNSRGVNECFANIKKNKQKNKMLRNYFTDLVSAQREGIRSSVAVLYVIRGMIPKGDALLDEIGVTDSKRVFNQIAEVDSVDYVPQPNNSPVRIFCATRFCWARSAIKSKVRSEMDYKGSDIMVRGLGLFYRNSRIPLNIRFVKKGVNVEETMKLIEEEGIVSQVTWCEEMTQIEVLNECKLANIVFEQLDMSPIGMAGMEAMAVGRPLIANDYNERMKKMTGMPSPICQASTPEEVSALIQYLIESPSERERIGLVSHEYVKKNFSPERLAEICLDRLAYAL